MRARWLIAFTLLWAAAAEADAPPAVVGGGDATIYDVAGTSTLVTVKLKEADALDSNLRILEVHDEGSYFSVLSEDNERSAFLFSAVKEIVVQGGKVKTKKVLLDQSRMLRPEEQKVVKRAYSRARELYNAANKKQRIKMRAAMLLAVNRDEEARDYLEQLAASNDLRTALQATLYLYMVGDVTPNKKLLTDGLNSGNRRARAEAATLSGLFKDDTNEGILSRMIQDRSADLAAPAARALAMLDNRDCIPTLLRMVTELNPDKGDAAVFALSTLGGEDIAQQMKVKYSGAIGETRFRIAHVLYNIGDPMGRELLQNEFLQVPTLAPQAALILAKEGDWDAMRLLRDRLNRRFDPLEKILKSRADAAVAVIAGGDNAPIAVLQDLLRSEKAIVRTYTCWKIVQLGNKQLLPITQPCIESSEDPVAMWACMTAVGLADPDGFRDRLLLPLY